MQKPLQNHSEAQYLELETNFINLFNFVQSLMTITEGEDLGSNSQRLSHFNALCIRITEGVERFSDYADKVRDSRFISIGQDSKIAIICDREEHGLIVEALEHIANGFPDLKLSDKFQNLADDISKL